MGDFYSKPLWLDGLCETSSAGKLCNGCLADTLQCEHCPYETSHEDYLKKHTEVYHSNLDMVLYMSCPGLESRNTLIDAIEKKGFKAIECTGGQTTFEDGNLNKFGKALVKAARKHHIKLYQVYRMYDPGLGLEFTSWWLQAGVQARVFEEYPIPDDVSTHDE